MKSTELLFLFFELMNCAFSYLVKLNFHSPMEIPSHVLGHWEIYIFDIDKHQDASEIYGII